MRKNNQRIRTGTVPTFQGKAWAMPSAAAAKGTYDTLLKRLLPRDPEDWSLI